MGVDWQLAFNGLTGVSTLAMAITGIFALNKWKDEQKRNKLINLIETINYYIQELQYYELESTVFSKHVRNNYQEDYSNRELIKKQGKYIDMELAENFGKCILCLKNWLIDHSEQENILDELNKLLNKYRIQIYNYVCMKIEFFGKNDLGMEIICTNDPSFFERMNNKQQKAISVREDIGNAINTLKKINSKLLN